MKTALSDSGLKKASREAGSASARKHQPWWKRLTRAQQVALLVALIPAVLALLGVLLTLLVQLWPGQPDGEKTCPTIVAVTASPQILKVGETGTVTVIVENPAGLALTYVWAAQSGQVPTGRQALETVAYTAPAFTTTDRVSVVVRGGEKCSVEGSVTIEVLK